MTARRLCVFVAVKGEAAVLKRALLALQRQTLKDSLWQWAALCRNKSQRAALQKAYASLPPLKKAPFQDVFAPCRVFQGPLLDELKNQALQAAEAPYVFFMDEDLILAPDYMQNLLKEWEKFPHLAAIGGGYISDKGLKFSGQVYNFVCNLWLKANPGFLLSGNMSFQISKLPQRLPRFKSFLPKGFGGEEAPFFLELKAAGLKARKRDSLSASHLARHSALDLISRALLHGKALALIKAPAKGLLSGAALYFSEPGPWRIKLAGAAYLLLVRFVFLYRLVFRPFRKAR